MKMFCGSKTRLRVGLLLSLYLSSALPGAADGSKQWSTDLSANGLKDGRGEDGRRYRPVVSVAATSGVVGVAWGDPLQPVGTREQANRWGAPREVTLLLFEANNHKLRAKRGPWRADLSFELYATAQGNFLLYLRHSQGEKQDLGDTLYLLSPAGEELKKLYVSPSVANSKTLWSEFMVSSSGRSVLVVEATNFARRLQN